MPDPTIQRTLLSRIFLSPDEPRLRAGWRISALTFIFLLATFLISLPILYAFIALELIADFHFISIVSFTISVYVARRWIDKRSFISLGLQWDAQALKDILYGVGISALMMGLVFIIELGFGWIKIENFAWQSLSTPQIIREFGIWVLIFIAVGWYEELLSRGYYLQNMIDGMNVPWALILSSLIFSGLHLANPGANLMSVIGLVAAGLFLALGYLRTKQLWLPIGLHIGWNLFEGPVFGFPVSGLETFRLIEHSPLGPELITGGSFGPEAGLIMLPAFLIGTALVIQYTKTRQSI